MTKIERRLVPLGVEARADGDGKRTLVGYAIVYDSPTLIGDPDWGFTEIIAPGAADAAIKGDIRALVDHDTGRVIGRTKPGTLRLASDAKGVAVEIDVPDTTDGNDLWVSVQRGDISGMSFLFRALKQEWDDTTDPETRTVTELELYEVSAVAFPAYEDSELSTRSKQIVDEHRAARPPDPEIPAAPVSRAAPNTRARLSKSLELKVRTTR